MSNTIITAVQQLSDNVILQDTNDVVCIDTQNNRIGIKTSTPLFGIDVSSSGIRTNELHFNNSNSQDSKIIYSDEYLTFQKGISCEKLIVNNKIDCSTINVLNSANINTIDCSFIIDVSFANINTIDCSNINIENSISVNTINSNTNNISFSECSLNLINLIDCSSIKSKFIHDTSFIGSHYTFNSDISFIGDKIYDFSGIVQIDGSLNVNNLNVELVQASTVAGTSDDRLKHNERDINNGLEIIRKLNPQIYQKTNNFKSHDFSGIVNEQYIIEAGLIAQEVEKIDDLSFCVFKGNDYKPYSLNYNNIFVYLISALKELDKKITTNKILNNSNNLVNIENYIKNQGLIIDTLNNKILTLENKLNKLENKNIK
jgi:hypothetical protein